MRDFSKIKNPYSYRAKLLKDREQLEKAEQEYKKKGDYDRAMLKVKEQGEIVALLKRLNAWIYDKEQKSKSPKDSE